MNSFTCINGHAVLKKSSCESCPVCEKARLEGNGVFRMLTAPARRAFENTGIETLEQLQQYSSDELLNLHGIGKTSIPKIIQLLNEHGLHLKEK